MIPIKVAFIVVVVLLVIFIVAALVLLAMKVEPVIVRAMASPDERDLADFDREMKERERRG